MISATLPMYHGQRLTQTLDGFRTNYFTDQAHGSVPLACCGSSRFLGCRAAFPAPLG
ncbi:hypothetical protein BABINDRAFT_162360 [Babjeviella inositovora NRRL Y-12698]|uniref:Uncharacterized protein n=1 Tax=Babjeviella inositovora NRRL Y-12698 TaxID=984486 RepID=A0A1E3QMG5_9ASCO|nr:uncharacterized protein BABINDRAFT_162360 [Babjeviella inositovora NRRL Y-12698]ODQ78654.1 hypothetical protein BABINDRAFT_162360 [Babjeviella inositovora NRRL Y-12698]